MEVELYNHATIEGAIQAHMLRLFRTNRVHSLKSSHRPFLQIPKNEVLAGLASDTT